VRYARLAEPEIYPDLLRQRVGHYLDADGLCFAPQIETSSDGYALMAVYFQNRYGGRAFAHVRVLPPRRSCSVARLDLPELRFTIECPGGAFGAIRRPLAIPAEYQGAELRFSIAADVMYPDGRGELLRYRDGLSVDSNRNLSLVRRSRKALMKLATGQAPVAAPARAMLTLPQGVRETIPDGADDAWTELIWWPQLLEREIAYRQRRAA
jgi:hypothetical protein